MKRVKVTFDFDGNTVTAGGTVWESLFVDRLSMKVEDSDYNVITLNKSEYSTVRELAEELILDKYTTQEVSF